MRSERAIRQRLTRVEKNLWKLRNEHTELASVFELVSKTARNELRWVLAERKTKKARRKK